MLLRAPSDKDITVLVMQCDLLLTSFSDFYRIHVKGKILLFAFWYQDR